LEDWELLTEIMEHYLQNDISTVFIAETMFSVVLLKATYVCLQVLRLRSVALSVPIKFISQITKCLKLFKE